VQKEITKLAFPNILSNISVPLLSTVDIALMGYISTNHIAAIGIASMLFNFIYWNMGFLRISTTGLISNAYGAKDIEESSNAFIRSIGVAFLLTILVLIFKSSLFSLGIWLFNSSTSYLPLIQEYYNYRILAAPAALAYIVLMGTFFGLQNTKIPLYITIIINLLNIAGNYITVIYLNMGIKGVALSTVISQYIGCLIGYFLLYKHYRSYLIYFHKKWYIQWKEQIDLLKLNKNIFLRTFLLTLSFVLFYRCSNSFGANILAANTILLQLVNWMSFGVDGFAHAAESIVGKYNGKKDRTSIKYAIKSTFYWGMGFAVAYSVLFSLFKVPIINLFTQDALLTPYFDKYYIWVIILPIIATPCYLWDGIYVGFKAGKSMRNSMFFAFSLYILSLWLMVPYYNNHALWASFMFFLLARGFFQHLLFMRNKNTWMNYKP